jgi:hypothetical protein
VSRAIRYTLAMLALLLALFFGGVYGLYFYGANAIPADWGPVEATYPASARLALWQSLGGQGEPTIEATGPTRVLLAFLTRKQTSNRDPAWSLLGMVSRPANAGPLQRKRWHFMRIAMSIQASRWGTDRVLDTVLDAQRFGGDTRGLRAGAMHVYGRQVETLSPAELQVLLGIAWMPTRHDPWCRPEQLRDFLSQRRQRMTQLPSLAELESALAAIRPRPAGHACSTTP